MIGARRITFQLTPLLDLLLIVIFAQYIEVRETARQTEQAAVRRVAQMDAQLQEQAATAAQLQSARTSAAEAYRQLQSELEEISRRAAESEQDLVKRVAELTAALEEARTQRDTVGELVTALFEVPEPIIQDALKLSAPGETPRTDETARQARRMFEQLAASRADEIVKHLLTYNELRKRCDIWDLYITDAGVTQFTDGRVRREFRAPTAEDFENHLFQVYKSLEQPKGLVIILVAYGDARFQWRRAALEGLSPAAERMRADSSGRTQFEFAVLGFRPRNNNNEEAGTAPR